MRPVDSRKAAIALLHPEEGWFLLRHGMAVFPEDEYLNRYNKWVTCRHTFIWGERYSRTKTRPIRRMRTNEGK